MNLFGVLDISASALLAERQRAEVVTSNLANADSSAAPGGAVYQRQEVEFAAQALPFSQALDEAGAGDPVQSPGVAVTSVLTDTTPAVRRFEPGNVNADADGYVEYPDIDPVQEMTDLMEAARSYQVNAGAVEATKNMIQQSIGILHS